MLLIIDTVPLLVRTNRLSFDEFQILNVPVDDAEAPRLKYVPSNDKAEPLVATLLPLRYRTPLAVPPDSVNDPPVEIFDAVKVVPSKVKLDDAPSAPELLY